MESCRHVTSFSELFERASLIDEQVNCYCYCSEKPQNEDDRCCVCRSSLAVSGASAVSAIMQNG